jgi:hypothetical protein
MDRAYGMHGGEVKPVQNFGGKNRKTDNLEGLGLCGRIMLKWVLCVELGERVLDSSRREYWGNTVMTFRLYEGICSTAFCYVFCVYKHEWQLEKTLRLFKCLSYCLKDTHSYLRAKITAIFSRQTTRSYNRDVFNQHKLIKAVQDLFCADLTHCRVSMRS